ncbi:MAG: DUF4435 domain-containing protein [Bacteroidales bacterium]|nr:DUF4435 domain-containing protein [Bacteroidales bacterium]
MRIILPPKQGVQDGIEVDSSSIVIIGANGSGKTRIGSKIEEEHLDNTLRISAQKSLSMPKQVSPKSIEQAQNEFWYGRDNEDPNWLKQHGKRLGRWQNDFNISLLNDFEKLMVLLHTEEYEESLRFKEGEIERPITKLDRIQALWEIVLPHRKLIKRAGIIETYSINKQPNDKYNSAQMSDGERVIFYFIGEVICSKENSIIIIDEPELHLHKSISIRLWDAIENERPDCTFIYLTHDLDFATSRHDSIKIWAKSYEGENIWDYEILPANDTIPEQVYLEILGSRKPILFFEGENNSVDKKFLENIYNDFTIKPLGSCEKVFSSTKAFNDLNGFHNIKAVGLIDRDRRTDEEIEHINDANIWVAKVAEIENFLLLESIIKAVARYMNKDADVVFETVKGNILQFFNSQKERQATEHTISRVERIFKTVTNNKDSKTIDELKKELDQFWNSQDFKGVYDSIIKEFDKLLQERDYYGILKVFNNKGMQANSNVANLCDINTKNDAYFNLVLSILQTESADRLTIMEEIKSMIE